MTATSASSAAKRTARLVRSMPAITLSSNPETVMGVLVALGRRGRCDAMAAEAVLGGGCSEQLLSHRALPPPAALTANGATPRRDGSAAPMLGMRGPQCRRVRSSGAPIVGDDRRVRVRAAADRCCPPAVLTRLTDDADPAVRCAAAANPAAGRLVLETLAGDSDADVRAVTAARADCPTQRLRQLAGDTDETVREMCATNPSTPQDLLEALAGDNGFGVRRGVASNPACGSRVLTVLAADEAAAIRQQVATHPGCGPEMLARFVAADDRVSVCVAAALHPNAPQGSIDTLTDNTVSDASPQQMASDPRCPPQTLERLALAPRDRWVRNNAAANPRCPPGALAALAEDSDCPEVVLLVVAANPNCTPDTLRRLAAHPNAAVQAKVAAHRGCPLEVRHALSRDGSLKVAAAAASNPIAAPAEIAQHATSEHRWMRVGAAGNPACDPKVLTVLATDSDNEVRSAVASNPNSDNATLERLSSDNHEWVRIRVAENPKCGPVLAETLFCGDIRDVSMAVLESSACPLHVIADAATHKDSDIRTTAKRRMAQLLANRS